MTYRANRGSRARWDFSWQKTTLLLVAMIALAVLAVTDTPFAPFAFTGIVTLGAAGLLLVAIFFFEIRPNVDNSLGSPVTISPTLDELENDERNVYRHYSGEAVAYFIQLLIGLPLFLQRVEETADLNSSYAHMKTTLTFKLEGRRAHREGHRPSRTNRRALSDSLLVPLILAKRGNLFDNLRVTDANGVAVPTVSQHDSHGLLVATMRTLFGLAANQQIAPGQPRHIPSPADAAIMWNVIRQVVCHGEKLTPQYRRSIRSYLRELDGLSADISPLWISRIRTFCEIFSEYYVIGAAPVHPRGELLLLNYEHDVAHERPIAIRNDNRRARFGLRPYSLDVPLTRVLQASSYHFQARAPQGQYVFGHHIAKSHSDTWLHQDAFHIGAEQHYARTQYQPGRPAAHFYVRRQGTVQPGTDFDLKTRIDFREIPPGTLGVATVLAVVSAIVQIFITLTHAGLDSTITHGNVDITAFLLAAPAFAGVILGGMTGPAGISGSSLSTYFGFIITMTLSLASALAYIWAATGGIDPRFNLTLVGGVATLHLSYLWTPIALTSIVLALYLALKIHHEIRYYLSLL